MPGDTLFAIAQRFNTTVTAILAANPQITDPNFIFPGLTIMIPVTPPTKVCPLLRQGDRGPDVIRFQTLLRVAGFDPGPIDGIFGPRTQIALLAFQQSVKEIEVTGLVDFETWTALGAECQPGPVVPPGVVRYVVRPGESLYIIAARFNVSVQEILRANPQITNPNFIYAGQVINVPVR